MMLLLDQVATQLGFDPFTYLVVAILGVLVWTAYSVIGSAALTGSGVWYRRAALLVAAASAVLFAYTASRIK